VDAEAEDGLDARDVPGVEGLAGAVVTDLLADGQLSEPDDWITGGSVDELAAGNIFVFDLGPGLVFGFGSGTSDLVGVETADEALLLSSISAKVLFAKTERLKACISGSLADPPFRLFGGAGCLVVPARFDLGWG